MDTKLFARIGAGAFVAVALTLTVLDLREEPGVPSPEITTVFEPDGDSLPAQLKACAAMGELALSTPDCRTAWAEKRRRFLGVGAEASSPAAAAPTVLDEPTADQTLSPKAN
jgi:conjugative transfer region protein TrbK